MDFSFWEYRLEFWLVLFTLRGLMCCTQISRLAPFVWFLSNRYVLGIDEAEAFSERLKRELTALEAANVHAILESEPLVEEV